MNSLDCGLGITNHLQLVAKRCQLKVQTKNNRETCFIFLQTDVHLRLETRITNYEYYLAFLEFKLIFRSILNGNRILKK